MRSDVSYFGRPVHRRVGAPFGVRQQDRLSHIYVLGKTGVGKSTLLETLALQDLAAERGFALIDPHGDLAENIWRSATPVERERITYLDLTDPAQPYGYNPLRRVRDDKIPLAAAGLLETFRKLWPNAWGVRMEHLLRNSLYALLERDGSSLPDILQLFVDDGFRKSVVRSIRNDIVRRYWMEEFEPNPPRLRAEATSPVQNKLGAILADPNLFRVLVGPPVDLRLRRLMDDGKILLVNLAKGQVGEDASTLLGGILVSTLGLAALSRSTLEPAKRRPFSIFVDEFQTFTTLSFVSMLPDLRKFGTGLVLANQYLHQLDPDIRHAVLGNAGTLISFRVGPEDAQVMSAEFQPTFDVQDLLNLPNHRFYLKLMIDGSPSRPFSATTLNPRLSGINAPPLLETSTGAPPSDYL